MPASSLKFPGHKGNVKSDDKHGLQISALVLMSDNQATLEENQYLRRRLEAIERTALKLNLGGSSGEIEVLKGRLNSESAEVLRLRDKIDALQYDKISIIEVTWLPPIKLCGLCCARMVPGHGGSRRGHRMRLEHQRSSSSSNHLEIRIKQERCASRPVWTCHRDSDSGDNEVERTPSSPCDRTLTLHRWPSDVFSSQCPLVSPDNRAT